MKSCSILLLTALIAVSNAAQTGIYMKCKSDEECSIALSCCPVRKTGKSETGDTICVPPPGKTVPTGVATYEGFYFKCSAAQGGASHLVASFGIAASILVFAQM